MYSQAILFLYHQRLLESGMPNEASLIAMEYRVKLRTADSSNYTEKCCIISATLPEVVELILLKFMFSSVNIKSRVICPDLEVSNQTLKNILEQYQIPRTDGTKTQFLVLLSTSS